MKNYRIFSLAALATIIATPLQAQDEEATSLAELLSFVEQGSARDNQEEMARIAEFAANNADQAQLLDDSLTQKANEDELLHRHQELPKPESWRMGLEPTHSAGDRSGSRAARRRQSARV